MKNYKISIPKPCHENWNGMTANEKGKFCGSCAKTVVDFTEKSTQEIQDFFKKHQGKKVCGHFKRKQLDSIVIQLPETIITEHLSFQKLFVVALLLVMGTTLFSCKTDEGKSQKIEKVEFIDTIVNPIKEVDTLQLDTIIKTIKTVPPPPKPLPVITEEHTTMGLPIAEQSSISCKIDSVPQIIDIMGDVVEYYDDGEVVFEEIGPHLFNIVEIPPKFKGTTESDKKALQNIFGEKLKDFVTKNFDKKLANNLGLKEGKHKMFSQFTIDVHGNITDIKIRAPHAQLKSHLDEVLQKLPQFIPGKQNGNNVNVRYTLPVVFVVE